MSYAEAVKRVNNEQATKEARSTRNSKVNSQSSDPPNAGNSQIQQKVAHETSHKCRIKEGTFLVDKVNFVAFICKLG